ncbi:uncharacterized protein LOC124916428 [Impatiens glandulifera]|uniref:uncharacterized protein LOC124916428 n=1 Tax=Impatiens glandulifera TaxID=253017 RepID=UPI001FB08819|nr:uncharacterized protein LOC124916428 [Impatiens glandulifera]
MRDFPTCLGENGVQVGNGSCSSVNRVSQNTVICVYTCKLLDLSCLITITWSKNLMGQCHSVEISDLSGQSLSKFVLKPTLFSKRKGFKSLDILNSVKIGLFWDLSSAHFGSGPEPLEGFYLALVCDNEMVLLIGDMKKEAFRKTSSTPSIKNATFISKREHMFGKRLFGTRVQFHDDGPVHELTIECDTAHDFRLVVSLDSKIAMLVKRIQWKFRGNHTIWVDGAAVEVFWDIHNWLFGTAFGDAVFVFQTSTPTTTEKTLVGRRAFSGPCVPQWPDCFEDSKTTGLGFSLILCVCKHD